MSLLLAFSVVVISGLCFRLLNLVPKLAKSAGFYTSYDNLFVVIVLLTYRAPFRAWSSLLQKLNLVTDRGDVDLWSASWSVLFFSLPILLSDIFYAKPCDRQG